MNKLGFLIVILILSISVGCASLWGIKSGAESMNTKIKGANAEVIQKEVFQAVSVTMASKMDSLQSGSSSELDGNRLIQSNPANELTVVRNGHAKETSITQIDSLKEKLMTDGSIKLNPDDAFLIDYLRPKQTLDTLFLANLYFPTESRGIPTSFQYEVKKDDQIFFEFENQKSRKVKRIEIIEGGESRFYHTDLKKKKKIEGRLTIQSDNIMTIKVVRSGFFKSVVRMKIRKLSKPQSYTIEMVNDTLVETKTVVEEVVDTLFAKVEEKKYSLSPRLDITHLSRLDFPIEINNIDNLIGWGYWLGLSQDDLEKYNSLAENDPEMEPLISFIKSELSISENHTYLPRAENPDVYLQINKLVMDTPSLNTAKNFGYFNCKEASSAQKAKVYLANRSKLYQHDISLLVVAVNVEHSQKEIEKEFYTEIPRLKLTLIP